MMKSMKTVARKLSGMAVGVALSLAMGSLGAAVLYEQLPNQSNGVFSNNMANQQIADRFSMSAAATLTSITWWGGDYGQTTGTDNFQVRLYSDVSGPGAVLHPFNAGAVSKTATGVPLFGFDEYQYDFTLPTALDLAAGTYYLFVQNLDVEWFWESGGPGDGSYSYSLDDGGSWTSDGGDQAFRLEGTQNAIPEPGSLALIGLALAGLGLMRARAAARG